MKAIDLFAGLGGFTEGCRLSGNGRRVIWCGNHNLQAVECHKRNHPEAIHTCQDLHQADWSQVPSHDLLLASQCCQGHSKARGKERAHHDKQRSTAWAVVSCAEVHSSTDMRIGKLALHKEKPGVISDGPCWCIWYDCWLYTGDTLTSVILLAIKEWKHDRHLVG